MILKPLQKLPKNVRDLGKTIVAKGFEKLPKVQKIAQSGHTATETKRKEEGSGRKTKTMYSKGGKVFVCGARSAFNPNKLNFDVTSHSRKRAETKN